MFDRKKKGKDITEEDEEEKQLQVIYSEIF